MGGNQLRVFRFNLLQLPHQGIIITVLNGGGIQHIVGVIVGFDFLCQLGKPQLCLFKLHCFLLNAPRSHRAFFLR